MPLRLRSRASSSSRNASALRPIARSSSSSASKPAAMTPPSRSSGAGSSASARRSSDSISGEGESALRRRASNAARSLHGAAAANAGSAANVARSPASSRGRTCLSAIRDVMRSTSATLRSCRAQRLETAVDQRLDRVEALDRRCAVALWMDQPQPQRAAAHAAAATVEQRQQGRRLVTAQRARDLQVAQRRRRQLEQIAGAFDAERLHVRQCAPLRVFCIGEQRRRGGMRDAEFLRVEAGQVRDAQLLAQLAAPERTVELPCRSSRAWRRPLRWLPARQPAGSGPAPAGSSSSAGASRASALLSSNSPHSLNPSCPLASDSHAKP